MELEAFVSQLWDIDHNRFVPDRDFVLDLQQGKSAQDNVDRAANPLFVSVNRDKFMGIESYARFYHLLDNYVAECGKPEQVHPHEVQEEKAFVEAVARTACSKRALDYVNQRGWWRGNEQEWKAFLHSLWFSLYKRDTQDDSSPFEHVFLGEIRRGSVIGFHNWISIFIAERQKLVDYKGFIYPRRRKATMSQHLIKIQFSYKNQLKSLSSVMFGVSPEFELILYTVAFLSGQDRVNCTLDDVNCSVVVHKHRNGSKISLGTAYVDFLD